MKQPHGFTLIELMITIAILAILAAIAVPSYTDYVTRGKIVEATSTLAGLRVKMEQYYQDNRNYGSTATACGVATPASPEVKYFTFSCNWGAGGTNQFFTITAAGADASMEGFSYTINEANVKTSTMSAPATTRGWATPASNCWVTRKPSQC